MTAILENLRRLEAARLRGDMSDAEYRAARARLMAEVEDARLVDATPRPLPTRGAPGKDVWNISVALIGAATCLTVVVAWLLDDLTLALTLSATILAALTVRAFRALDD